MRQLLGHDVHTAQDMGCGDLDNGDLLDAMGDDFDALVTTDRGIPHQQHLVDRAFGVVVLRAKSNRLADLLPLVPETLRKLTFLEPGTVVVVGG